MLNESFGDLYSIILYVRNIFPIDFFIATLSVFFILTPMSGDISQTDHLTEQ